MTWAWRAPLPPGPKIVLLALADIADDDGVCWPGHRSLAIKCSTTVRTVQRTLAALAAQGRLLIEPRYRHDGSRSSNRYRLPIGTPHDKLSPGGATDVGGPSTPASWPPDAGVVARTTNEPLLNPPQPPQQAIVTEIEAEQALIAANRELIARFEQKIQDSLAGIWGEEERGAPGA